MAETVAELNPLDYFWQAVLAVEFSPFLLRRHHQLEGHGQSGLAAEAPLWCGVGRSRRMMDVWELIQWINSAQNGRSPGLSIGFDVRMCFQCSAG